MELDFCHIHMQINTYKHTFHINRELSIRLKRKKRLY